MIDIEKGRRKFTALYRQLDKYPAIKNKALDCLYLEGLAVLHHLYSNKEIK